jgi:hypothetical protein
MPAIKRTLSPIRCLRRALPLAALALAACVTRPQQQAVAPEQPPLLPPASLDAPHQAQQILRAAFGEHEATLRSVVRTTPQHIEMITLTALGQRAMSIDWNGQDWKVDTAPMVPAALRAESLVADLQLALWPLATLQAAWQPAGWEVSEPGGGVRRLRHEGRLVAEVHYADADPWRGRYWIANFRYGYALAVQPDNEEP